MTKAELINRIIDRITDPWSESPEDYRDAELIDLDTAKEIIEQCRLEDPDYEPEDRLPEKTTPELMAEAYNCNVRMNQFELKVNRLAQYITDNEMVCEYDNYYRPIANTPEVIPVDFLYNSDSFPFECKLRKAPDLIELLRIGRNSAETFNLNDEFCWFDKEKEILHSSSHPFGEGFLDAKAFARFVLLDAETLAYFLDDMNDNEIMNIFRTAKDELLKGTLYPV